MHESDIEAYLVRRVKELGGETRKVKWIGRKSAPDRIAMLPEGSGFRVSDRCRIRSTVWVELKRPGGAATFPKDAHERAQHREHERMRKLGQYVVVIDSFDGVDELLDY